MQVFRLPGHVTRNAVRASRLLGATPNIEETRRRDAVARWRCAMRDGLDADQAAQAAGSVAVSFDMLPLTVTFRYLADPMSVERVDPFDLAATYGSGFALKSVVIETSDWPLTDVLESRLPWLEGLHGNAFDGSNTSRSTPLGLTGIKLKSEGYSPL